MTTDAARDSSLIREYKFTAAQALVKDHLWRFDLGIRANSVPSPDVLNILEPEWRLCWSLGHIPWCGWRSAIQSALLFELNKLPKDLTASLYQILDESLATATVNSRQVTEGNKRKYLEVIKGLCSEEAFKSITESMEQGISNYSPIVNQASNESDAHIRLWNSEFIFIVFTAVFKTLAEALNRNGWREYTNFFGIFISKIISMNDWPIPPFYLGDTIEADLDYGKTPNVVFNFWRWQYTQRNPDYKRILDQLTPLRNMCSKLGVNLYDLDEYFILRTRGLEAIGPGLIASMIHEGNELTERCLNRFGYLPTWPITGQPTDQILSRMISGEFTYWERFSPRAILDDKTLETSCRRIPSQCDELEKQTILVNDGHKIVSKCSQQCLMRHINLEFEAQKQDIRKERSRIQQAGISRAVGLLMYDLIEQFEISKGEAIRIIVGKYFPDDNPGWSHLTAMDAKEGEQWHDYKERFTQENKIRLDYKATLECIHQARFLPLR